MDAQRGQRGENERGREEEISTHRTANQHSHQRSCDSLYSRERERDAYSQTSVFLSLLLRAGGYTFKASHSRYI